ncbi:hypothetical protein L5515_019526 [Caenorhabditis briggsae]|uniref:Uncharacterized protein n=1 Tax=Caenorhabditis briggsae TaxID=6238 RepID=A0AAE9FJL1_CAEBR|nr:hypothetical protein L5515_019526 [Caenorhabditis briggsae]
MLKTLLPLLTLAALCLGQYCPRGKKVSMKVGTKYVFNDVKVKYPNKYAYLPRFFTESNEDWLAYPTEEDVGSHDIYKLLKQLRSTKRKKFSKMEALKRQLKQFRSTKERKFSKLKTLMLPTSKTREAETRGRMEEIVAPFEAIPITEEPTMKESLQFEDIESSSSISSDKKSEKNEVFQMEESDELKIPFKKITMFQLLEATTEAIQINKGKEVFQTEDIEAPFEAIPNTEEPKIKESLQIEGIVNEEKEALQNGNIEYFAEIIPITPSSSPTFSSPTMTSSLLPPHGTTISTTLSESKNEINDCPHYISNTTTFLPVHPRFEAGAHLDVMTFGCALVVLC